jgi:two-component system sensor histidine kinase YesM
VFDSIDRFGPSFLEIAPVSTGLKEFDMLMARFGDMTGRIRQPICDVERKEAARRQAELEKLYYQINPHFLMNSLNSIHWLARLRGQDDISQLVYNLNTILSYSLARSSQTPCLRSEIEVVRNYIVFEQNRHSFHVEIDVEEGPYLNEPTPRLILQPLVENAVCHGMDVDGNLKIVIRPLEEGARIVISDDGCGLNNELVNMLNDDQALPQMGGIGLRYIHLMLRQYYENDAFMYFKSTQGHGTTVTLTLGKMKVEAHDQ